MRVKWGAWAGVALLTMGLMVGCAPVTLHVGCTGSMEPTLSCGDKVRVVPVDENTPLAVGDIIVFSRSATMTIIHRIVGTTTSTTGKTLYYTKGDYGKARDERGVSRAGIQWKVYAIVKRGAPDTIYLR